MYNILFICYGNICRSPMAEMIFKDLVYKNNKKFMFNCESKATSIEELGNPIYPEEKIKLLMTFTKREEEIEDPWYTGRFEKVYEQIKEGCEALFDNLVNDYYDKEK